MFEIIALLWLKIIWIWKLLIFLYVWTKTDGLLKNTEDPICFSFFLSFQVLIIFFSVYHTSTIDTKLVINHVSWIFVTKSQKILHFYKNWLLKPDRKIATSMHSKQLGMCIFIYKFVILLIIQTGKQH